MRTISRSKGKIRDYIDKYGRGVIDNDEYTDDELGGYLIQEHDGKEMLTKPAPEGEPRYYHSKTNTGGRRFVCYAASSRGGEMTR